MSENTEAVVFVVPRLCKNYVPVLSIDLSTNEVKAKISWTQPINSTHGQTEYMHYQVK